MIVAMTRVTQMEKNSRNSNLETKGIAKQPNENGVDVVTWLCEQIVLPKFGGERRARSAGLKTVGVSVRVASVALVRRIGVRRGWLRFPETPSERYDVETGLWPLGSGRIFGVIGCVNETMIDIVGPSKNDPTAMKAVHFAASISTPST
ncbi:hypothetical protein HPB47_025319 [Ixodes persulcatus]|uniref:Uncharacterized protein n=1 Tax=Ixodes persulcatus TaxID=34615 RepID=A0AC60Q483_IXOPE|nr:hypothetical protein HPB47_025319 [Ixodes persulcatus]